MRVDLDRAQDTHQDTGERTRFYEDGSQALLLLWPPPDEGRVLMAHIVELADKRGEQRHAALAYLAEAVDECYTTSPAKCDPWRVRAETALVRRAHGPWPLTAEEAADYLEGQVAERFPGMSESQGGS